MSKYDDLGKIISECGHFSSAVALLSWDQEVMMPQGGSAHRAQTIGYLSGVFHEKLVGPVVDALKAVEDAGLDDLSVLQTRNIHRLRRELDKQIKLPTAHVVKMNQLRSQALQTWVEARKKSEFSIFEPMLSQIVDMRKQEAQYLGYVSNPYDALIDAYESEMTAEKLISVFEPFKKELGGLLSQIAASPQIDDSFLRQEIPAEKQLAWSREVLLAMGYNMDMGRQDISAHPFTINMHPTDVRITTMVKSDDIREMLYSSIHEGGHALYEQGLPIEHFGWPAGEACSLGIHESQSRLWENNVCRSIEFWEHFFPSFSALFPDKLKGKGPEDVFKAVNKVGSNFIRISADELTYHFHVILRFEIENALMNGEVEVKDLPALWNEKIKKYLDLDVQKDSEGVLQDIHWSHGSIGYFPTYSLGSFYAAQLLDAAKEKLPSLPEQFAKGEFGNLKEWLNTNIHAWGKQLNAEDLCKQATGKNLDVQHFIRYAKEKFGRVYGISIS